MPVHGCGQYLSWLLRDAESFETTDFVHEFGYSLQQEWDL
jgi:hypothetical protein